MTALFHHVVNDIGEEIFGVEWLFLKPYVSAWIAANPTKVLWLVARIRTEMQAGRL